MIAIELKFYEPEEEVCEGQGLNCAYVDSTGAIWTPTVFTQFLLGIIATRVMHNKRGFQSRGPTWQYVYS